MTGTFFLESGKTNNPKSENFPWHDFVIIWNLDLL